MKQRFPFFLLVIVLLFACASPTPSVSTVTPMATALPTQPIIDLSVGTPQVPFKQGICGINDVEIGFVALEEPHPTYTRLNTNNGLANNTIRSMKMTKDGLLIGFGGKDTPQSLEALTPQHWEICQSMGKNPMGHVNAIAVDRSGHIWVVTDGSGTFEWTTDEWHQHNTNTGMVDDRGYGIAFLKDGSPVVATWEGLDAFVNGKWVYVSELMDPVMSRHIHVLFFASNGEVWVGSINGGLSRKTKEGEWIRYDKETLGSDAIRVITTDPPLGGLLIGTNGGGISYFDFLSDNWITLTGLPEKRIVSIAVDHFFRRWIATPSGTYYQDDGVWRQWSNVPSLSIAFGCVGCAWDETNMFIGTDGNGLIHDRLPQKLAGCDQNLYPHDCALFPEYNALSTY